MNYNTMKKTERGVPPVHPGIILKEKYLLPLGITQLELAENIGVVRKTISEVVNGRVGVSVEMAMLLSKSFETPPEFWLELQCTYDLWHAAGNKRFHGVKSMLSSKKFRQPAAFDKG